MAWYDGINNFLASDQAPIVLGNAASALMGSEAQNSWQGQLGRFASDMAKSNIADKALKEKQNQDQQTRQMIMNYLIGAPGTGVGLTPEGIKGDTSMNLKFDPDGGYTKTVKGNSANVGGEAPQAGGVLSGQQTQQAPGGFTSNFAGQNVRVNPSLVPLF